MQTEESPDRQADHAIEGNLEAARRPRSGGRRDKQGDRTEDRLASGQHLPLTGRKNRRIENVPFSILRRCSTSWVAPVAERAPPCSRRGVASSRQMKSAKQRAEHP
jgi:hypothetical protein